MPVYDRTDTKEQQSRNQHDRRHDHVDHHDDDDQQILRAVLAEGEPARPGDVPQTQKSVLPVLLCSGRVDQPF